MKYYIMFGPPGAGKGTHAAAVREKYNLCHLSTGELLRAEIAEGTQLGLEAKKLIEKGSLVPDSMVEGIIEGQFNKVKGVNGFLLDGFPRTLGQAEDLDAILAKRGEEVTAVISLMISDETVKQRIAHRAAIEGRADDASEETINNRIKTYHTQTEPLIEYYKAKGKYYEVQAEEPTIEQNRAKVLALMETIEK
ncbi:MAG: adenylate kinase [Candidatus Cryptobacteroides sp.]